MIDKIQKFTSFLTALVIVSALVAFATYDHKVSNNLILMTDSSFINKKSLEKIIFLEMDTLSDEKVNFFEIEKKLHLHPHVKEVKVYKDLTGNLNVSLSQFKPVARIVSGKFSDHYVDKDGIIFPTSKNFSKRVILIHLPDIFNFESNSLTESVFGKDLMNMINLINENDFFRKIISEIDVDRNKNIVIHPVISKQKIIFGYPDMLEEKFQKISLFYNDIVSAKGWNTYKSVNVKFKNQIICDKFS